MSAADLPLGDIATPAYVADRRLIADNLELAERIKAETGCKMLLATKAFAMAETLDLFYGILDGTTASGLHEAQLGHEQFGGEVHAYSPAFTQRDIQQLTPICNHISFNSVKQFNAYHERFPVKGLRVNPRVRQVRGNPIYDPSAPRSRFGVEVDEIDATILEHMNLLHVHNLCENMAEDSAALITHLMDICPHVLASVAYVNLGGGHYITHPDYLVELLIDQLIRLRNRFDVQPILEPGGALVYEAGYLVTSVVDILHKPDHTIAILDCSVTCHMPDVLEVPYRPAIIGEVDAGGHAYLLAGNTCLTGDLLGTYRFADPLKAGDKLILRDMLQYSVVKNTTFNGIPLPDLGIIDEDGRYQAIKRFTYNDFASRLGFG